MKEWTAGLAIPQLQNGLDYVLVVLLAWGAFRGFRMGFFTAILSLVGFVGSWFVAGQFTEDLVKAVQTHWPQLLLPSRLAHIVGFLILFFVSRVIFAILGNLLQSVVIFGPIQPVNRVAGAIFGLARQGAILTLFFGLLAPFILSLNLPWLKEVIDNSVIALSLIDWFYAATPWLLGLLN